MKPFAIEVHLFSEYRAFENPVGDPVWFPTHAEYRTNMGITSSDALAENKTLTVDVTEIKFNVDIDDEQFQLLIPRSAKVWDGVTGLGFLKPGDRPEALFPEEAERAFRIRVLVTAILILFCSGLIVWYRRRRRHRLPQT
jgi:hypothetical protein